MNTTIYYFTGTGNSLKIARDLANEIGDTQIIPVHKAIKGDLDLSADCIGVVFPVYMWGMPLIVANFVSKLKTNKYVFAIANCGGMGVGALNHTEKVLSSVGTKLSAGFRISMPGNYTPMYGAQSVETQNKLFARESSRIKEIAVIIKQRAIMPIETSILPLRWLFSTFIYNLGAKRLPLYDKKFWITDKCNSCGTCAKICPVENIRLVNGKPTWLNHCEQCMACLQWCPKEAIQLGKNTINRKRYRNPFVSLKDMMI